MVNIILANATIANSNRGCTAIALTAISILQEIFLESGKEFTIYLTDSHQEAGKEYKIKIGENTIRYISCEYPASPCRKANILKLAKRILLGDKSGKIFKTADFIFDIGQGDSFSDIYGRNRFDDIDLVHKLARRYHKPYCLLPQTIGPFYSADIKQKAEISIRNASLCLARDRMSYEYVRKNIPSQTKVRESIDLAFFLPFQPITHNSAYIHVGLNVSALLWNGGYTKDNQFGLICDYQKIIHSIIDFFLQQEGVRIHLIAHVASEERGIENDYEICYDLWREYDSPNVILAPFALGSIEVKSYIAGMDFFIGARMHSTIAAFSTGVPVLPMAYSRKFNGLFMDTLGYSFIADMKIQSDEGIMSSVKNSFKQRLTIKNEIKEKLDGIVKERKESLITELKDFLRV